jgi:hypothetical protein
MLSREMFVERRREVRWGQIMSGEETRQTAVIERLKEVRSNFNGGVDTRASELNFLSPHLEHSDVIQSFSMWGINGDGDLKGLICETKVTQCHANMSDIVPSVGREWEGGRGELGEEKTDQISAMQSSDAKLRARSKQFKAMSNCAA